MDFEALRKQIETLQDIADDMLYEAGWEFIGVVDGTTVVRGVWVKRVGDELIICETTSAAVGMEAEGGKQ